MSNQLTNYRRDAFINSVMNDVPHTDYREAIANVVTEHFVEKLPPAVRRVYDDTSMRNFINLGRLRIKSGYYMVPSNDDAPDASPELIAKVQPLVDLKDRQDDKMHELRTQIKTVVYGCRTYKQLRDKLPEFEKYIPKGEQPPANELVVANVVTAFMEAGWPKGKSA